MKTFVYGMLVLLILAHQDFWWWDDSDTLVFGFIPIGLAYHAGISLTAAVLWTLAVRYCWPTTVDRPGFAATAEEPDEGAPA